jgi:hypothetical protein
MYGSVLSDAGKGTSPLLLPFYIKLKAKLNKEYGSIRIPSLSLSKYQQIVRAF